MFVPVEIRGCRGEGKEEGLANSTVRERKKGPIEGKYNIPFGHLI